MMALHAPWLIYNSGFKTASNLASKIQFPPASDPLKFRVRGASLMRIAVLSSQSGLKQGMPSKAILRELPNPYICAWETAYAEGLDFEDDPRGKLFPPDSCACKSDFWDWKQRFHNHCTDFEGFEEISRAVSFGFELLGSNAPDLGWDGRGAVDWDQLEGNPGIAYGRRFMITDLGFLGLAPLASMPGDEVCMLFGGTVPYVIRSEGDRFKFIGECYVLGIMDSEVVTGLAEEDCKDFTFI